MSYHQSLYQKIILEHNRSPRNFGKIEQASHVCPGNNPLCGDQLTVYLICENDEIKDITFEGEGCAISKASASMMTEALKGKHVEQAKALFKELESLFKNPQAVPEPESLGDLQVFENIRSTSSRIKCVTLAWKAFLGALDQQSEVSTENE